MIREMMHEEDGATAIEYGLIAALISLASIVAFKSLGLNLAPCEQCVGAEVLSLKPGTQATSHEALRPGLVITAVGGTSVSGKSHAEVTEVIMAHPERPLLMQFASSAAVVEKEALAADR